jgi:hypothetical protein
MTNSTFRVNIFASLSTIIILMVCIFGCNTSDETKELTGGYFYQDEGDNSKYIINHLPNVKGIYAKVIAYDYDSQFIIAAQQPIYEDIKSKIGFELRNNLKKYPTNSRDERVKSEKEADSILKIDPYYKSLFLNKINYWIIRGENKKIYGPLTRQEYIELRLKLGVSKNLELQVR